MFVKDQIVKITVDAKIEDDLTIPAGALATVESHCTLDGYFLRFKNYDVLAVFQANEIMETYDY